MRCVEYNKNKKQSNRTYNNTLYFIFGYLLAWLFYSFLITFLQWWLHHLSILQPMMISNQAWFTSTILFLVGFYQWLPLKQRCLTVCQSPINLVMKFWGEGLSNSIKMGFILGQYYLGCCWLLMSLLFVTGVMNLKWIFILMLIIFVEKLSPWGINFSKLLGVGLIAGGVVVLTN